MNLSIGSPIRLPPMQLILTSNTSFGILFIGRAFYGERPPIKSAIFATDPVAIHYATLHAVVTQGSPIKVRVFEDRQKAAQWLNVPIELLTAATSGDTRSPGTKN